MCSLSSQTRCVSFTRRCTRFYHDISQRDLPTRTKRKIHAIGGARGMWSLPVRQPVKVNGSTFERPANPFHTEKDTLIISTDATPSPGLSRVSSVVLVRGTSIEAFPVDCFAQQPRRDTDYYTNTGHNHRCRSLLPRHCYTPRDVQRSQCCPSAGTWCVHIHMNGQ